MRMKSAAPVVWAIMLSGCAERLTANDPPSAEAASSAVDSDLAEAETSSELRIEDPVKLD